MYESCLTRKKEKKEERWRREGEKEQEEAGKGIKRRENVFCHRNLLILNLREETSTGETSLEMCRAGLGLSTGVGRPAPFRKQVARLGAGTYCLLGLPCGFLDLETSHL